jgi:hypothetical protein
VRLQTILGQHDRRGAEARSLDNIGADFEESVMHRADQIRPGAHHVLVASFETHATVVFGAQVMPEHAGAERAVDYDDSLFEQLLEQLDPGAVGIHSYSRLGKAILH